MPVGGLFWGEPGIPALRLLLSWVTTRVPMAKTVVALYRDLSDAQAAIGELLHSGVARERISLIHKDGRGDMAYDTSLGDPLQSSSTLLAPDPNAAAELDAG